MFENCCVVFLCWEVCWQQVRNRFWKHWSWSWDICYSSCLKRCCNLVWNLVWDRLETHFETLSPLNHLKRVSNTFWETCFFFENYFVRRGWTSVWEPFTQRLKNWAQSLPRPLSSVLTILFGGGVAEWRSSFSPRISNNFVSLKRDRKLLRRTPALPTQKLWIL